MTPARDLLFPLHFHGNTQPPVLLASNTATIVLYRILRKHSGSRPRCNLLQFNDSRVALTSRILDPAVDPKKLGSQQPYKPVSRLRRILGLYKL